jgi:hypothetical protein
MEGGGRGVVEPRGRRGVLVSFGSCSPPGYVLCFNLFVFGAFFLAVK